MKLRNGKIIGRCGHSCDCTNGLCCTCSDKRPTKDYYIAWNNCKIGEYESSSKVSRNFYYCSSCKTHTNQHKMDFSNMPRPKVSQPFVFAKSTEQKLKEAEEKIRYHETTIRFLESEIEYLKKRI